MYKDILKLKTSLLSELENYLSHFKLLEFQVNDEGDKLYTVQKKVKLTPTAQNSLKKKKLKFNIP